MSAEEAKAVVQRYWKHGVPAALKGDPDALKEHLTENFVIHTRGHNHEDEGGFDDHFRAYTEAAKAMPGVTYKVHRYVAEGDTVVAHWHAEGRHDAHHKHRLADDQLAPTQADLEINGVMIYRVENGRIAELWNYDDHLEALIGAGALKLSR